MPLLRSHQQPLASVVKAIESRSTYARELGSAVAALGNGTALLDVKQADFTTGGLDDSGSVGTGVPAADGLVSFDHEKTFDAAHSGIESYRERLTRCGGGR